MAEEAVLRTAGENKWDSGLAGTSDSHTTNSLESKLWSGRGRGTPLGRVQGEVTEKGTGCWAGAGSVGR